MKKLKIVLTRQKNETKIIDKINEIRSSIPAVTHVDYSARIQTVHKQTNEKFYDLIKMYDDLILAQS